VHAEHIGQLPEAGPETRFHADLSHLMLIQLPPVASGWARFGHALKLLQQGLVRVDAEVLEHSLVRKFWVT